MKRVYRWYPSSYAPLANHLQEENFRGVRNWEAPFYFPDSMRYSNLHGLIITGAIPFLILRQYFCNYFWNSKLLTNGFGGTFMVSGQHYYLNVHLTECFDGIAAGFLFHICCCNDTQKAVVFRKD